MTNPGETSAIPGGRRPRAAFSANPTTRACLLLARGRMGEAEITEFRSLAPRVDWDRLFDLARNGGVAGLVIGSLERAGADLAPAEILMRLARTSLLAEVSNRLLMGQAAEICRAADRLGLVAIPTKGVALLMDRPYRDPGARAAGDIDLITTRRDFPAFERLLVEMGYRPDAARDQALRHEHHLPFTLDRPPHRVLAELHWTPFYSFGRLASLDEAAIGRAVEHTHAGTPFRLLDGEDTLLGLLLHLAQHRYRGSLKWAVDVVATLDHFGSALRWPLVWERARSLGAERAAAFGLSLVARMWPGAAPGIESGAWTGPRWEILGRLNPPEGLIETCPQPGVGRRCVIDLALRDSLAGGLRHVVHEIAEVVERNDGPRLPGWLARRGLGRRS